MKFNEAVQIFEAEIKIPKKLKLIEKKTEGNHDIEKYGADTNLKFRNLGDKEYSKFELTYENDTYYNPTRNDPDVSISNSWTKMYKVPYKEGYGTIAKSEGKINKGLKTQFSEKGYKDWTIYLYATQKNGIPLIVKHFNKPIKTEKQAIGKMFDALKTLSSRLRLRDTKGNSGMIDYTDPYVIIGKSNSE